MIKLPKKIKRGIKIFGMCVSMALMLNNVCASIRGDLPVSTTSEEFPEAYQSYIDKLKQIYEELLLLDKEKTVAIAIATRPDCFSEEIYDLLSQINQKKKIIIELGLQTSNEKTAEKINRCSTNSEFIDAVLNLKKRNIEKCYGKI